MWAFAYCCHTQKHLEVLGSKTLIKPTPRAHTEQKGQAAHMCTLIHSRSSHEHSFAIIGTPTISHGPKHLPAAVDCTSCVLYFPTKLHTPTASLLPTLLTISFLFFKIPHAAVFPMTVSESTNYVGIRLGFIIWTQCAQSQASSHSHGMWSVSYGQFGKDVNEIQAFLYD